MTATEDQLRRWRDALQKLQDEMNVAYPSREGMYDQPLMSLVHLAYRQATLDLEQTLAPSIID